MATENQVLTEIGKLAARSPDRIKLAIRLSELDADPSAPSTEKLLSATRMSPRALAYLRALGRRIHELNFAEREYVALGWTKCVLITRLCPKEKFQEAKNYGLHHTVDQLRQSLKGRSDTKKKSILLRLNVKQYEIFEKVLVNYGAQQATSGRGLRFKEKALMRALAVVPMKQKKT
jgi:hypothetical protein